MSSSGTCFVDFNPLTIYTWKTLCSSNRKIVPVAKSLFFTESGTRQIGYQLFCYQIISQQLRLIIHVFSVNQFVYKQPFFALRLHGGCSSIICNSLNTLKTKLNPNESVIKEQQRCHYSSRLASSSSSLITFLVESCSEFAINSSYD